MIALVFGTRPDAIKLGPVAAELRALNADFRAICTGQHRELLAGTPAESDLANATSLGLVSDGNVMRWVNAASRLLSEALRESDVVVVQGDTMSAFAAASVAREDKVLCHVEAGVRSHNLEEPWPEERFRVQIDATADWYYAPTTTAYANLVAEGVSPQRVRVTGNTVVSALARYADAAPRAPSDHAVVTLHRREWTDGPHFQEVLAALCEGAAAHSAARWVWPMHPTVAKRLGDALASAPPNLVIVPPMAYRAMVSLLSAAFGILSDSGGCAEEAATLGVPSVQLRNVSDRPEAIEAGVSQLQPPTRDGVLAGMQALAAGEMPRRPTDTYGSVDAAAQVARHLVQLDTAHSKEYI